MDNIPRLDKRVVKVTSLDDIEEERKYWLSKSPSERIEAIEINRRMIMAKIELHPDFKDLLKSLNSHDVRYMLVGG